MKNTSVMVALVAGISLMVSTAFLSSAIKEYGRSLERVASSTPRAVDIPSRFTVSFEGGHSPLRFDMNTKP